MHNGAFMYNYFLSYEKNDYEHGSSSYNIRHVKNGTF